MNSIRANSKFSIKKAKTFFKIDNYKDEEKRLRDELSDLQYRLYAEGRRSVLIVLQGMDASGKDGLIAHIMNGVNPQGINVTSFKHPSALELSHDFIWRHYVATPEKGMIGIFNRSHYENVLISKVHPELVLAEKLPLHIEKELKTENFWKKRYERINHFEKNLIDQGTIVLKFFLHLSKEEQAKRFMERIENHQKHWKLAESDIKEREYWSDYMKAYESCIRATSTKNAPWYVLPADDKKTCRYLALKTIVTELKRLKLEFPQTTPEHEKLLLKASKLLKKEGN